MARKQRDGSGDRKRGFLPFQYRRSLLDMLWRAGGASHADAPHIVFLDRYLLHSRGNKPGKMQWRRLQNMLQDILDGRAVL